MLSLGCNLAKYVFIIQKWTFLLLDNEYFLSLSLTQLKTYFYSVLLIIRAGTGSDIAIHAFLYRHND